MRRIATLKDIIQGESEVVLSTRNNLKGFFDNISPALNILVNLMYYTGEHKDINSQEGLFHSYCWHQYIQAPHSFRSAIILFERAYYRETTIIIRSLLESFIQIRYLYKNKAKIEDVWAAGNLISRKKHRITFKAMFDEISPGFYEKHYGEQLSGIAHSKSISHIFRVERKSAIEGRTIFIPEYNQTWAGYIVNHLIALIYGYLNYFALFFAEGFSSMPVSLSEEYKNSLSWLISYLDKNQEQFPQAKEWHRHINKITRY